MELTYKPIEANDYEMVRQFLIDMGWQERVRDRDRFERMMRGASRTVVALQNISRKWTMPVKDWRAALNQFAILFEGRLPLV